MFLRESIATDTLPGGNVSERYCQCEGDQALAAFAFRLAAHSADIRAEMAFFCSGVSFRLVVRFFATFFLVDPPAFAFRLAAHVAVMRAEMASRCA